MKINYAFFILLAAFISETAVAQTCSPGPAPSVSGNTLAACTPSATFTLTANGQATNTMLWFSGANMVYQGSVFATPPVTASPMTYSVGQASGLFTETLTMPSYASTYPGYTRGYWFQAPVAFTINGVWVPTDVGTGNASAAIVKLPTQPPAYSTTTNSFQVLFLAQNQPGTAVMSVTIPIAAGDYIGVLGNRGSNTSYGTSPFQSTLGSNTITITRFGMQYDLTTNIPQDVWTESGGSVGRVFLYSTVPCLSTLTPVTLSVTPNAAISVGTSTTKICAGSNASLTAQGLNTYTWSNNAQGANLVVNPSSTTVYSVNATSGTCTASSAITISVDPGLPTLVPIRSSTAVCLGQTVSLTGSGNSNNTYTWSSGVSNAAPFSPSATASYTLKGANSCGTSSVVTSVTVNPNPSIITGTVTNICDGESATLTASGANNYTWTPGNINTATTVVTPSTSIAYQVVGDNQFGCTTTTNQVIIVNANPTVAAATSASSICPGASATISASGSGGIYNWSTGGQGTSLLVTPLQFSVYTVTLTNSNNCSATATVGVDVYQPTVSITQPTSACIGSEVNLVSGAATQYTWNPGNVHFQSLTFTAQTSGSYTLNALVNLGVVSCVATATTMVTVNTNPAVTAGTTRTVVCKNEKGTLNAQGALTYTWAVYGTGASVPVTFSVTGPQTYTVTGTDVNGCRAGASFQVTVNSCNDLKEYNGVSAFDVYPNPSNGTLDVRADRSIVLIVYTTLGQKIADVTISEENGYGATLKDLAEGVYLVCPPDYTNVKRVVVYK
jgi:hypothetical protein